VKESTADAADGVLLESAKARAFIHTIPLKCSLDFGTLCPTFHTSIALSLERREEQESNRSFRSRHQQKCPVETVVDRNEQRVVLFPACKFHAHSQAGSGQMTSESDHLCCAMRGRDSQGRLADR